MTIIYKDGHEGCHDNPEEYPGSVSFHVERSEVDIYIGGYFLGSSTRENISREAWHELTGEQKEDWQ